MTQEEMFDVCDEMGCPTGETVSRSEAHRLGIRHRTAHIWIAREQNGVPQVLLQKRSAEKDSFPGEWDTSSAGHIHAGDEPVTSALRELEEELGIAADQEELKPIGTFSIRYSKSFHDRVFSDNECAFVYLYDRPVDAAVLNLQKEEIEAVDWFPLTWVVDACEHRDGTVCVPKQGIQLVKAYYDAAKEKQA